MHRIPKDGVREFWRKLYGRLYGALAGLNYRDSFEGSWEESSRAVAIKLEHRGECSDRTRETAGRAVLRELRTLLLLATRN